MNKVLRGAVFSFLLLLVLGLNGCGTQTGYTISEDYNAVTMREDMQLLEVTDNSVSYSYTGMRPLIIEGQIIGSSEGSGFLRRVTAVNYSGNTVTVQTEEATLAEAVIDGDFSDAVPLNVGEAASADTAKLVMVNKLDGVSVTEKGIPLNNVTIFSAGGLTVKIPTGFIEFDTDLDIGAKIRKRKLEDFHAIATGSMAVDLELQASATQSVSYGKEISLAQFKSVAIQFIGPVPVVEVITLDFSVGFDASLYGTLTATTGVQGSASVSFGAQYDGSSWQGVREASKNFSSTPPTFTGSAGITLRGYVRPSVSVKFYALVGPVIGVEPYLQFDGTLVTGPALDWLLSAGVDVDVAIEISLLGFDIASFGKTFNVWSLNLASGQIGASYNLTGIWDTVEYEDPDPTPGYHVFTLTQSGSNISGTWDSVSLSGTLSGNNVTLTTAALTPITYTGTVAIASGNYTMSGTYGDPVYIGPWSATKR